MEEDSDEIDSKVLQRLRVAERSGASLNTALVSEARALGLTSEQVQECKQRLVANGLVTYRVSTGFGRQQIVITLTGLTKKGQDFGLG